MELLQVDIPLNCRIFDSGDVHLGPLGFHEAAFQAMIDEIAEDPYARLLLKGDLVDCITPSDKRFSVYSNVITPEARNPQYHADKMVELLRPVASKIIALQWGNHEFHIANTFDVTRYMCKLLGVPFGGYTAVLTFKNPARNGYLFKWLATHGRKQVTSNAKDPIQAKANMQAALKNNLARLKFSDCIYMTQGHGHSIIVVKPTVNDEVILTTTSKSVKQDYRSPMAQNAGYIPPECRYYAMTGSFLKTFSDPGCVSYAELAQYGPVEIGCVEVTVADGKISEVKKRLF